jgi:hypothetical protein
MGDDRSSLDKYRERRPGKASIIDLMALVAGTAIALSFDDIFGNNWIESVDVSGPGVGGLWATLIRVGEFASAAGIALATLVLVRHLRTGGIFRPAEWLLIANAMRTVHWKLVFAGGMDWAQRVFGWGSPDGRFRAWYTLGMIGFSIVVAALLATRRTAHLRLRLPLLFCLPLFALWGPAILFSHELNVLLSAIWPMEPPQPLAPGAYRGLSLTWAAFRGLMESPEHLIICLPFVATIGDRARRDRPSWTWLEWSGLGMALLMSVSGLTQILVSHGFNYPQISERLASLSVWAGWWLAELAMAWLAVRYMGSRWDGWISTRTSPEITRSPVEL